MNKGKLKILEDKVEALQGNKKAVVYVFLERGPNKWEHKGGQFTDEEKETFVSKVKKIDTVISVVYGDKKVDNGLLQ